jgi:hypothetical protein
MKQILGALAGAVAVGSFLMVPVEADASCLGGMPAKPIAYQSATATVSGTAPASPFTPTAKERAEHPIIVGLWKVTLSVGGEVTDVGFDAWHSDGTEVLNDVSPISHNVCLGTWVQVGIRTFKLKHMILRFDGGGNFIGTAILRETNVVNSAGNAFAGTFAIEFFDLDGNPVFNGAGDITGERVTVD